MRLHLKKYQQEGDLAWEYNPFHNLQKTNVEGEDKLSSLCDFDTSELNVDLTHPLNIDCQPSYDGTVNIIINDDKNPPRLINSRFSKIENNRYRVISRNQSEQTNIYQEGLIDQETRLFRTVRYIPKIYLNSVKYSGRLMGGNYTFYIKYADNDYNKTNIVAESGIVSIFKGTITKPETISGTIQNERTDKSIELQIDNVDNSFDKVYLYFTRETCDTNGFLITEAYAVDKPYEINNNSVDVDKTMQIVFNGFENCTQITLDELNMSYYSVDTVKTQAQSQNRLFFGNITENTPNDVALQNLSYYIPVTLKQDTSIGNLTNRYTASDSSISQTEYYNPQNIHNRLGYWPDEMYRLGIVYILNDDSLTNVYNLRGHYFKNINEVSFAFEDGGLPKTESGEVKPLPKFDFISDETTNNLDNTLGVFRNPDVKIYNTNDGTCPLYYNMDMSYILPELSKYNIKGYFFVRQKRLPTTLCQGLEVGINKNCFIPMLWDSDKKQYFTESFVVTNIDADESTIEEDGRKIGDLIGTHSERILETDVKQSSGLLCVDAMVNPSLQSVFDSTGVMLSRYADTETKSEKNYYTYQISDTKSSHIYAEANVLYVNEDVPMVMLNNNKFSTRVGAAEDVSQVGFFEDNIYESTPEELGEIYKKNYDSSGEGVPKFVKGIYCPYLATNAYLASGAIYNVKIANYKEIHMRDYFKVRGYDNSAFSAISHRYAITDNIQNVDVYRGDCYSNLVTIRINRNFTDPEVPVDDIIVKNSTWRDNFKGFANAVYVNGKDATDRQTTALERIADKLTKKGYEEEDDTKTHFYNMNRADVNAVPLGMWATFRCLSNYNLGLRSIDEQHFEERAIMGNSRGFYPVTGMSTASANKVAETQLLNDGYSITLGRRLNTKYEDVPYIKDQFDNRIMFSNSQVFDEFKNGYRIFQGLSYQDIDRQYGAIVKLLPHTKGLLCVFEHGVAVVPVNEKALMQTTAGLDLAFYGAGVLQEQVNVISQDFGSTWQESIIKTPIGVYGVDTECKKIWQYTESRGFRTISDFKIQRFLNDHLSLLESDKTPMISLLNVKTHYNNYKGDVMFTFYNYKTDEEWNFCYNERMDKWITRYSWTPLYSENINNIFWSFDKKRSEVFAHIYDNKNCLYGLHTTDEFNGVWNYVENSNIKIPLTLVGYDMYDSFDIKINKATSSFIDENREIEIDFTQAFTVESESITTNTTALINACGVIPLYYKIYVTVVPKDTKNNYIAMPFDTVIGMVTERIEGVNSEEYDTLLGNGFYLHGRSGIFDTTKINYFDSTRTNEILPTKWYGKQEPFEVEFVVNGDVGMHKIFNDLIIISNNVQPKSFEFSVIGDVYDFNKAGIYREKTFDESRWLSTKDRNYENGTYKISQMFDVKKNPEYNSYITWDPIINEYWINTPQECKNIKEYGRLTGNIHYKEDAWYMNIEPILFKNEFLINGSVIEGKDVQSTRIRDKFMKVRIKYTGEDLVIITALQTMVTLSYS